MESIEGYLSVDHKRCDQEFAEMETCVVNKSWEEARQACEKFSHMLNTHLRMEEEILFPEFEKVTGAAGGPTQVMKMEHEQMRNTVSELIHKIDSEDYRASAGLMETLMILMQQHNMKEEQILYRMADQMLAGKLDQLLNGFHRIKLNG